MRDTNGKDMPGEDDYPYPMRQCPTETGYGANTADIERGYLIPDPDMPGDGGVNEYPMIGRTGFLYRGRLMMDR